MRAIYKHSNLLRKFLNYGHKFFYNIGPWGAADELQGQVDLLPDLLRHAAVTVRHTRCDDPHAGGFSLADVVEHLWSFS